MEIESVRIEALKIAVDHDPGFNPQGWVSTAAILEQYIVGTNKSKDKDAPVKRKPGRPKKNP
jgi:hypothetical protein|tara:strand:- start:459 stop:644 length:186 start_codon:yes stop_codon:yes gene_type:complete